MHCGEYIFKYLNMEYSYQILFNLMIVALLYT